MSGIKDPLEYRYRGVYGVYSSDCKLMYVGSTSLGLKQLEENHRKAREKGYDMTHFRTILEEHQSWTFVWLIKPFECQQPHIEFAEQMLIQAMNPEHNKDKSPYLSSIRYGRYGDLLKVYRIEII